MLLLPAVDLAHCKRIRILWLLCVFIEVVQIDTENNSKESFPLRACAVLLSYRS